MVQTEHLQPGMRLRSDVRDGSGRLLAKADSVLTAHHIKVFKTWGITEVSVNDDSIEEEQPQQCVTPSTEAAIKRAHEIADELFSLTNLQHPAMQQLFDISVQYIAVELNNGKKRDQHV